MMIESAVAQFLVAPTNNTTTTTTTTTTTSTTTAAATGAPTEQAAMLSFAQSTGTGKADHTVPDQFRVSRTPAAPIIVAHVDDAARLLSLLRPVFVVLYEPHVATVRALEVHQCEWPSIPLRVYLLAYEDGFECVRYQLELEREQRAFEALIEAKASYVPLRTHEDERADYFAPTMRSARSSELAPLTALRQGTGAADERSVVVVDSREFRSGLPSMLHRVGFNLVPVTLEVGDYVLTPELCLERKSLSDLTQSLSSGRLYAQCEAMQRLYKTPVLLIEFSENQPFALDPDLHRGRPPSATSIHGRLMLLIHAFPRLCILWSRSPQETAALFEELKRDRPDPDPARLNVAAAEVGEQNEARDVLLRMPGVNTRNQWKLLRAPDVTCLADLGELSKARLIELLGTAAGTSLHTFLHLRLPRKRKGASSAPAAGSKKAKPFFGRK